LSSDWKWRIGNLPCCFHPKENEEERKWDGPCWLSGGSRSACSAARCVARRGMEEAGGAAGAEGTGREGRPMELYSLRGIEAKSGTGRRRHWPSFQARWRGHTSTQTCSEAGSSPGNEGQMAAMFCALSAEAMNRPCFQTCSVFHRPRSPES